MFQTRRFWVLFFVTGLFLLLISLPYLFAGSTSGNDYVFAGFLNNPLDGNTYLAKMYQGWRGDLRFQLPYTAEPGAGGYINMLYLALGHLARWLNVPILCIFHISRILSSLLLTWSIWCFYGCIFSNSRLQKSAFVLTLFGSGMGWILLATGAFTSDFWVAETYPWLSAYTNPHFPLGLGLILWLVMPGDGYYKNPLVVFFIALLLGLVSPFGILVSVMVLGGVSLLNIIQNFGRGHDKSIALLWSLVDRRMIWVFLGGGPILVYDYWAIYSDPVLSGWNAQNLTLSPPLWDLVVSLSPILLFAIIGGWHVARGFRTREEGNSPSIDTINVQLLLVWALIGFIVVYLPFSLQRRFMMGYFIPFAGLAAYGLDHLFHDRLRQYTVAFTILLVFSVLTNMIIILAGVGAVTSHDPKIYLTKGEDQALEWLAANTSSDALILASPEMGLWIPAHTGRRVIYGHPYETVDAEAEEEAVLDFFTGKMDATKENEFLSSRGVDYVFYGPHEQALGDLTMNDRLKPVFDSAGVTLYAVQP
jgi:hypothetical protein